MRVAVLDIGKTNAKIALVDVEQAAELEVSTCPTPQAATPLPYPHVDIDALETFFLDGLKRLGRDHSIDAITVTTHGACAVLVDDAGVPVLPVLDYEFSGPAQLSDAYDKLRADFEETGSPRLPDGQNIGAQIYWQQQQFPVEFARATKVLTWPQFWVSRLCGVMCNDPSSLGSHSDLHRPVEGEASSLVERASWSHLMPRHCKSGEFLDVLLPSLATRTDLPAGTPVHAGIHDSNASLVPHLLSRQAPFSVVSTGTWFISMAVGSAASTLDPSRDTLINVDAFGRPVPSARYMGGREHALLARSESMGSQSSGSYTTRGEIALKDVASTQIAVMDAALLSQVLLMPSQVLGTGPYPQAQARWLGDVAALDNAVREAVIAFYLALMTAECQSLIGSEGAIVIEGPLTSNTAYLHMLAAATGRAVEISISLTGTSIGAAMLVAASSGGFDARGLVKSSRVRIEAERLNALSAYAHAWREAVFVHLSRDEKQVSEDE